MEVIHFPIAKDYLPKHFCSLSFSLVTSFLFQDSSVEELCWAEMDTTKTACSLDLSHKEKDFSFLLSLSNVYVLMLRRTVLECEGI